MILSDVQLMLDALSEDVKNLYFEHVKNKTYQSTPWTQKFCYIICAVDNNHLLFMVEEQRDGK